jgi:hypothetical protein
MLSTVKKVYGYGIIFDKITLDGNFSLAKSSLPLQNSQMADFIPKAFLLTVISPN